MNDFGQGFRSGSVSPADEQRMLALHQQRQDEARISDLKILLTLVVIGIALTIVLYRKRRPIIDRVDRAIIEGAATMVRGGRATATAWGRFKRRVLDRAH